MSKKIFINNLNTFVSKQLFAELRNDQKNEEGEVNPDSNKIYGTYIDKDSSSKPEGVTKMLKRSKPRLAMKYLANCDLIIYDLHEGNPRDVYLALDALRNSKSEEEKVLILISSLMAWQGTPRKLEEIKVAEDPNANKKKEPIKKKEEDEDENNDDEEKNDDDQDKEIAQNQEEDFDAPKQKIRKRYNHIAFTELDFAIRNPIDEYRIIKEIEDDVLNFKIEKQEVQTVKTYVISAGILYGKGEAIFNSHIQKAWLQDPVRLPYVGEGNNLLPTIHVTDLARMVKAIYEKKPPRKYIFAIDNNPKPTQKKLIAAISNGIGTGLIESIDIPENFKKAHPKMTPIQLNLDWKKSLLLNLKVQPSSLFIKQDATPVQAEAGEEPPAEEGDIIEIDWLCKPGLPQKINLVKEEFEKERGLRPIKIFIAGPPCSGKSFYSAQLAEHYNVPHIHLEQMLQDLLSWDNEKEERYNQRVAIRDQKIEALRAQWEYQQQLKLEQIQQQKMLAKQAQEEESKEEVPEVPQEAPKEEEAVPVPEQAEQQEQFTCNVQLEEDSDDDFKPIEIKEKVREFLENYGDSERIPEEIINEAIRWRLNQNDCQNRGYVLDGYPKNYRNAKLVFVHTPTAPEKKQPVEGEEEQAPPEEEVDPNSLKPILQTNIYPESVISLRASDQYLKKRAKQLLKYKSQGSNKWDLDRLVDKLQVYNMENNIELFKQDQLDERNVFPVTKFFQENKTEIFEMQVHENKYEMLESQRIYVERHGRPFNYLKSISTLNDEREKYLIEEEENANKAKKVEEDNTNQELQKQKAELEKFADERLKSVRAHMLELESCDDLNMRQFLMKYIIPLLTEGMIEVWKVGPLDPVDYLAEYIFKKSCAS